MIYEALELIRSELEGYVNLPASQPIKAVKLASPVGSATVRDSSDILLTLVNMEEENTLKNTNPYIRKPDGSMSVKHPPVFLNLYLLISCYFTDDNSYGSALKNLSKVVQCFQSKNMYNVFNTPNGIALNEIETVHLRVTADLCSLSFEKINQLWGTLGGRQLPFVMYKLRLVEETANKVLEGGGTIMSITGIVESTPPVTNS